MIHSVDDALINYNVKTPEASLVTNTTHAFLKNHLAETMLLVAIV